jgi:hypothetical protein
MKIPINEFEQHVNEVILKRGNEYFKNGNVGLVDELISGEYEAVVNGSETYIVNVTLKEGIITKLKCTCPYDMGPECKHEVAVLYYLQQELLNSTAESKENSSTLKGSTEKNPARKKTVVEQVDELLDKLSAEDLKKFIRESCKNDRSFRELFIAKHLYLVQEVSKEMYSKQIKAIVNSVTDRDGYINYKETGKIADAVSDLSDVAYAEIDAGNYRVALYICYAILEEMADLINHGEDDSEGDFGSGIELALGTLLAISEEPIDESLRKELFDYCVQAFIKRKFDDNEWNYSMLEIAISILFGEKEKQTIVMALDSIKPNGERFDYDYEQAQKMKLKLIRETESEENAQRFLEANLTNSDFRREILLKAIDDKEYNRAIELAKEGILLDEKDKPGLADEWQWQLLQIYQQQNDTTNIIQQARYLFLKTSRYPPKDMFEILKKQIPPAEWQAYFNQLIEDSRKSERNAGFRRIAEMYVWEQQWENLMALLLKSPSLENISGYEKYLAPKYASQLVGLYQSGILSYMVHHVSRDHYKVACDFIRRMIKIGGREEANILIKNLRTLYPKRSALMDELGRV